jgi:endonuclease/exonuclease/phosphatase family metal-dependent hydrolase
VRLLTWNLFHGRSVPPAGRSLLAEFAARLAAWDWDVALLQEVPPWWTDALAAAAGAEARAAPTSRNALAPLRRAAAERLPDLIGANGGGANAVLVRGPILDHATERLRLRPERRVAQLVRLPGPTGVVNLHASRSPTLAAEELDLACRLAAAWAPVGPLVIGGDFNLRLEASPAAWLRHVAGRGVDHVLARGLDAAGPAVEPSRKVGPGGRVLSDHPALVVELG